MSGPPGSWRVVLAAALAVALGLSGCVRRGEVPAETPASFEEQAEVMYVINMTGNEFSPDFLVVPPGAAITFVNNDSGRHSVTPDIKGVGGPDSELHYPDGIPSQGLYRWVVPPEATSGAAWYFHCRFQGGPGDGMRPGHGMTGVVEVGGPVAW